MTDPDASLRVSDAERDETLRILGEHSVGRLLVAVALMALYAAGGGLPAWAIGVGIAALMASLCAGEPIAHAHEGRRTEGEPPPDAVRPGPPGAEPAG